MTEFREQEYTADEFARTALLIGEEKLRKIRSSSVMVLGVGGVGSHCVEALARAGVGRLLLVDNDRVSLTNINRQSIAYHSTVGRYKTEVMRERIQDICPETEVKTFETFVLADNTDGLFAERPDYIVDAIDTVTAKLAVIERANKEHIPVISCMGAGNKLDPAAFRVADIYGTKVCPLARAMRRLCRENGVQKLKVVYSEEIPMDLTNAPTEGKKRVPGSVSFVPSVAGLIAAGEVVKDLTGVRGVRP